MHPMQCNDDMLAKLSNTSGLIESAHATCRVWTVSCELKRAHHVHSFYSRHKHSTTANNESAIPAHEEVDDVWVGRACVCER